jgi:hypothetical protein
MMVEELDSEKLVARGYVADLCERFLDVLSEVLRVSQEELLGRWDKRGSFAGESSDEGSDFDPPAGEAYELRASWRFLDRDGLHARPAVLLQKALLLPDLHFDTVEAQSENGHVARMQR